MRRFLAMAALLGVSAAQAAAPATYAPYHDGFLVEEVPAQAEQTSPGWFEIVRDGEPGSIELVASTPQVRNYQTDCGANPLISRESTPDMVSYSCQKGQRINYHIEKYGETHQLGGASVIDTLELTIIYPAAQRAWWDPIVTHVSRSLQFASKVNTHG